MNDIRILAGYQTSLTTWWWANFIYFCFHCFSYTSILIQTLTIIDARLTNYKCCSQLNICFYHISISPWPNLYRVSLESYFTMFFCFSWIKSDCIDLFLSPVRTGLSASTYWKTIPILKSPVKSIFYGYSDRIILLPWISITQYLNVT